MSYPDAAAADRAAAGGAYLYSRQGNPTTEALERAVADLEGAEAGASLPRGWPRRRPRCWPLATAARCSPRKASTAVPPSCCGTWAPLWADPRLVPGWDTEAVRAAIGPRTRASDGRDDHESALARGDLPALGALARERSLPLIVDSTFASPRCADRSNTGPRWSCTAYRSTSGGTAI